MASPVQAPPPSQRRRSFAGPVVLIILGVILLMATMGVLQWEPLLRSFGSYWPALIILWGVIKLVEHHRALREGVRPRGIGAGGVFLLILLIMIGLAATPISRVNWRELGDQIPLGENGEQAYCSWFGHCYSFDDQLHQEFPSGSSLRIIDDRGAVTVTPSDENQIHVVVRKRISAPGQSDANKWNAGTKPQFATSGNILILNANTQGAGDHWVATDMDVSVPRKAAVVISTRRGDVSVTGRDADTEVSNQHGDVSLSDINGKANVNLDGGSARISSVSSDAAIQGRGDNVSLTDVKGAARLSGEFDSVKLSRVTNGLTFKSARTDLEFSRLNGDLDMDSGDMRATDILGPFRMLTRSKDIRLSGLNGDLRLQDENGTVEIRVNKLGSMQVDNRSGDVQIYLPDKAGFQLQARARGGEVESDFNELKIASGDDQATATGSVGAGGPRLVINNEHGTIEIRKGSAVAETSAPPHVPKPPREPKEPVEPTEN
jgi:DUF4097 and DUF4098 domain-containing protein YvlB